MGNFWTTPFYLVYIENTYIVLPYIKNILTSLGELIIFEPLQENYHFSQPSFKYFLSTATLYTHSIYLSMYNLLSFD